MKRSERKHLNRNSSNPALVYYKEYGLANLVVLFLLLAYTFIK